MGNGSCKKDTTVKTSIENSRKPKPYDDDTSNGDEKSIQSSYYKSIISKQEAPLDNSDDDEFDETLNQVPSQSTTGGGTLSPGTGEETSQSKSSQPGKSPVKLPARSEHQKLAEEPNKKTDQLPENDGNATPHSPNAHNHEASTDQRKPPTAPGNDNSEAVTDQRKRANAPGNYNNETTTDQRKHSNAPGNDNNETTTDQRKHSNTRGNDNGTWAPTSLGYQPKGRSYCKECAHCKKMTEGEDWMKPTAPSSSQNVIHVKTFDIKAKNTQNHMANGLGQPLHYTRLPMILKPGSKSSSAHTPYPNYDELESRSHRLYLNGGVLSTN